MSLENEYIRVERVHKGKIFQSLEKGGKRCFPLSTAGIQACLEMVADDGSPDGARKIYAGMYDKEPDIWDALFEHTGEADASIFVKRFNLMELPKSNE